MFLPHNTHRRSSARFTFLHCTLLISLWLVPVARAQSDNGSETRAIDTLLKQMTLEEKIGQMSQLAYNTPDSAIADEAARTGRAGSFLFITDPAEIDHLQHLAVEGSRLHIPLLFGFDVIHGLRTVYPVPLALAASWDPALAEDSQRMAAREASAVGIRWTFAPMVDIARDARWGRIMEGAGEDPFLGRAMAAAQVRGFQGTSLANPDSIVACVKHYAGYGAAEGGRDYDSVGISESDLQNIYLPPFHAAAEAGAGTFMTAYMDLNGVPAGANPWLIRDTLKGKWKFDGFVVSDWNAVENLIRQGFAKDPADAAARSANAGMDMEMTGHVFNEQLAAQVRSGAVSEATIDDAVRRILRIKYRLGLFSHPYVDAAKATSQLVTAEQRQAARKAGARTAILLRNEAHTLPLEPAIKSIAVIGPLADSKVDITGSWSLGSHPADAVSVLEGIRARFAQRPEAVRFAKGVEIGRDGSSIFDPQFPEPVPTLLTDEQKRTAFMQAIDAVRASDVTVIVLGESQNMNGERASRSSLTLPGRQQELLEAAVATGKPVVVVLLNGRPLAINWAAEHAAAILEAWYPGTEGGNAIADLLFGDVNPGGKLPVSFPRSAGQEPLFYARNLTQNPKDTGTMYWDGTSTPLYPFGFGLSYTSFTISNLKLSSPTITAGHSVDVSVDVKNTGGRTGDEVVQLYTHQRYGSAVRPVRELKGFQRVTLKPGESRSVTLHLDTNELAFWSAATHDFAIEPSTYDIWVGNSSTSRENHTTLQLTK